MHSKRVEFVVRAAVLGLLAAAHAACGGDSEGGSNPATSAENEVGAATGAQSEDADSADSANADSANADSASADAANADPASADSTSGEAAGATGNVEGVTSVQTVVDLDLADFTQMCDEAVGVVEVHDSCAGAVSGPGFSYDIDTDQFTEHTCRGFNTCRGFSCVVDDA